MKRPTPAPAFWFFPAIAAVLFLTAQSQRGTALVDPDPAPIEGTVILYAPEPNLLRFQAWLKAGAVWRIDWGAAEGELTRSTDERTAEESGPALTVIDGLEAGTRYWYRLATRTGDTWTTGTVASCVTPRKSGQAFSFVIEADPHLDESSSYPVYKRNLALMSSLNPDFIMDLGDTSMIEKLTLTEEQAEARYAEFRSLWASPAARAPFFMVLGNHDGEYGWKSRRDALPVETARELRRTYLPNPAPQESPYYTGISDTAYAFQWGDALIMVLDPFSYTLKKAKDDPSGWTLGEEQLAWLGKTLTESTAKYRFLFIHHLVGGSGSDNRGGAEAAGLGEWGSRIEALLIQGKVDVVFHGHDHFYAREERKGIVYQLVPQPSLGVRQNSETLAKDYGYGGDILPSPGFLLVSVTPESATVEFLDASRDKAIRSYTIKP